MTEVTKNKAGVGTFQTNTLTAGALLMPPSAQRTANYTADTSTALDFEILVDPTAGSVVITLPDPTACAGRLFFVKENAGNATSFAVKCGGTGKFDGVNGQTTGLVIARAYGSALVISDGTDYNVIWGNPMPTLGVSGAVSLASTLAVLGIASFGSAAQLSISAAGLLTTSSSIKSSSATAGIGYGTGAGGTVTQGTSKATGVTLNKVSGEIVMHNASLADNATVKFALTNSAIAATDVVVVCPKSGMASAGAYIVWAESCGSGTCNICVRNVSGGALTDALKLSFAVIKGVAA